MKLKVGYVHYDGDRSQNFDYRYGDGKSSVFTPNKMREGGPNAILHLFGADRIPLNNDTKFNNIDYDIIYFWIQGGIQEEGLVNLRRLREDSNALFIQFFDDVYWLESNKRLYYYQSWDSVVQLMDVLSSGYIDDDKRITYKNKPWKYLPYPHDIEYMKKLKQGIKEKNFFSMVHGRYTEFPMTIQLYKRLHDEFPDWNFIFHPYHFYTKEQVIKRCPDNYTWLKFTPIVNDWLELLGRQTIQIDEYPVMSQSQVTTQAACLGVPTISHNYNFPATICFPELIGDLENVDHWFKVACRLVRDEEFYRGIQTYAYNAVEEYSFDKFKERIINIYKEFRP